MAGKLFHQPRAWQEFIPSGKPPCNNPCQGFDKRAIQIRVIGKVYTNYELVLLYCVFSKYFMENVTYMYNERHFFLHFWSSYVFFDNNCYDHCLLISLVLILKLRVRMNNLYTTRSTSVLCDYTDYKNWLCVDHNLYLWFKKASIRITGPQGLNPLLS